MNIYIDESGSINNHNYLTPYFVIALVHVTDGEKLIRAYTVSYTHLDVYKRQRLCSC